MENEAQSERGAAQAVIFDLDGVLMDSEWLGFLGWHEWVERNGGKLRETDFPGMTGLAAEDTAIYVMRVTGLTFDITESCDWVWEWVLNRLREKPEPLPGAVQLVRSLALRGYPLAIASNAIACYIDDVLAAIGLLGYFPVRVSVEKVNQGKPAPDVYLRAAGELGVTPERCLAIEDSRVGLQAAVAAGMRVIAVPGPRDHRNGFHGAWRVYDSLAQVAAELDMILAA